MTDKLSEPGIILLVEDEPDDARLLMRAFQRAGVQNHVRHLTRGDTALAYLQGLPPWDNRSENPLPILMILDLKLPGMTGLELLCWLRQQRQLRRIPVLVFTGEKDQSYMGPAYDAGANSYLRKPADSAEIERVVSLIKNYWLVLNEAPLVVGPVS
ncbi:MAG TPA: response regulator [Candidatus Angelobacter sp.]|nr:response regulator [Candidatus Angelobacter sp.]